MGKIKNLPHTKRTLKRRRDGVRQRYWVGRRKKARKQRVRSESKRSGGSSSREWNEGRKIEALKKYYDDAIPALKDKIKEAYKEIQGLDSGRKIIVYLDGTMSNPMSSNSKSFCRWHGADDYCPECWPVAEVYGWSIEDDEGIYDIDTWGYELSLREGDDSKEYKEYLQKKEEGYEAYNANENEYIKDVDELIDDLATDLAFYHELQEPDWDELNLRYFDRNTLKEMRDRLGI